MEGNATGSWLSVVLALAPIAIKGVDLLIDHIKDKKNEDEKNERQRIEEQMDLKIKELQEQNELNEEINRKSTKRIQDLENLLKENMDEMKRRDLEREKELIEKEKKERYRQDELIRQKKEALLKCKESLSNEFSKGIIKCITKFSKEEKVWLENLNEPEIQTKIDNLKNRLDDLFDELYKQEKIIEKMNNKFISVMQSLLNIKELEKMNFVIIGTSGVGKSTLINELFGEMLAKEGMGKRTTLESKKYESKLVPFLTLYDTRGTEIGDGHKLEDVKDNTLKYIDEKLNSNDPNEHIHCILYCTTNNRFFIDELKVILKLREKYDGKRLPIVIVYTRGIKEVEVQSIRNTINEFLNENNESLSDDIFGITFIKINAREEKEELLSKTIIHRCFGLSDLMSTCFKKGEKAYRIAIKNSLIQISKNSLLEYVNNICSNLLIDETYGSYLNQEFEPNFSNFIAYCFEKITDVKNQEGINIKELEYMKNYINEKEIEKKEKEDNVIKSLCMFCEKPIYCPYKCEFCQALSCELCFFKQFETKENPLCLNCEQKIVLDSNSESKNKSNQYDKKINKISKNIIYNNILINNLNPKSLELIHKYVKYFSEELIVIVNKKFDVFIKESAKKLYTKMLEKYKENVNNNENNVNLNESLKSKEELKLEVEDRLNEILKERAIENFLKKNSADLYQHIIQIFKNKCIGKIEDFINNLDNNNEVMKFFESCNVLNEEKKLKIQGPFDKYINKLKEKEEESLHNSLISEFGDQSQFFEKYSSCGDSQKMGETNNNYSSGETKEIGETNNNPSSGETKEIGETNNNSSSGETKEIGETNNNSSLNK